MAYFAGQACLNRQHQESESVQRETTSGGTENKDPYLKQKIMSAKPEQLISYMYDAILAACRNEDSERAERGLAGLIDSLVFDQEEVSLPMFQVYQYCLDQIRKGNFTEVAKLIGGMKSAWSEAMNVN